MASELAAARPAEPEGTPLQVLRRLDSGPRGLTDAEAEARLAAVGENTVPEVRTPSWPLLWVRSLRDPFTAVLLCLGLVSTLVASWGTAAVILSLVVVSCVLRATGEHRADRSMAALRELVAGTATVLRRTAGGERPRAREVPVTELVPGDVLRLGPGDRVPADVRLLRARGLTVHQAALTGESAPVAKAAVEEPGLGESGPFGQAHLCFQGSSVATGTATAVVVHTGARTRFAAAHGTAGRGRGDRTALSAFDRSVQGISWVLIRFMLLTPPLVLVANAALRGRGLETLPFAVAVAVGLTPEMLPVIVTLCLARGTRQLAGAHGVIVKRLPALHDLGAVDVLCVDKTGTLTQDRPVVERALDADGRDDPEVLRWAAVGAWWTLQLAELPAPDALDEALLEAAGAVGEEHDGVAAVPFDPVRRLATAVVRGRFGRHVLVVRGAVEDVLERCALEPAERERLRELAAREADAGLRLLALATAERAARTGDYTPADERGLTFRGLIAFRDALAPTAAEALRGLAEAGVTVKILTGDHPGTAARVCRDLGLEVGEVHTVGSGPGGDGDLAAAAARSTVFARCTPDDKARVVAALRDAGHTVGFLGDGANDVPALRAADVGVAPRAACDIARDSADVVLADKDLTAIGHAVVAGRRASGNIASYLRVTLSSNLGNVIAMLVAGLLLPFLPMLPVQVLVQNLCFDAAQSSFAHDRPGRAALRRPTALRPRAFLRFITGFGALNAVADFATFAVLALVLWGPDALNDEAVFHSAWFTENLLTQALVMVLLRTGRDEGGRRRLPGPVGRAAAGLALAGLLLPVSPLGPPLGMTGLPLPYYVLLAAVLAPYGLALAAAVRRYERRTPEAVGPGYAAEAPGQEAGRSRGECRSSAGTSVFSGRAAAGRGRRPR
ncbi:magnesium-translocating P-type ATPase [Streptomyces sp. 6-11-2]|uniref:magnesium-translocating P-type ATPase n=1 Tax=Streptomyces sp. 6-11-2 TaxID=2585753 RepID=UPI001143C7A0|nr:magnesium-translocating P-type ATPase [Streptomyces sp. 6-11-2]GED84054.1 magnesium-translocating P-type ATPase [Streptomyces sp. 6-11-2]